MITNESKTVLILKLVLGTLVSGFLLQQYATPFGVFLGGLATLLGHLLAFRFYKTRLKTLSGVAFFSLIGAAGLLLRPVFISLGFLFQFSIETSIAFSENLSIFIGFLGLVTGFRFLVLRKPTFAFFESALFAGFFVWKLSLHRDLALHRPQSLSDFAWDIGTNPFFIFLFVGFAIFVVSTFFLIRSKKTSAALFQILLISLIGYFVYNYYTHRKVELAQNDDPLGMIGNKDDSYLRGKKPEAGETGGQDSGGGESNGDGSGGQSNSGGGRGQSGNIPDEMPFKDNYSSQNDQPKPIALVDFGEDYSSPVGFYYFRQTAFSEFNGHRLVQNLTLDSDIVEDLPYSGSVSVKADMAENKGYNYVFVPTKVFLMASTTKPFGLTQATKFERIENPNPSFFSEAYATESQSLLVAPWDMMVDFLTLPNWDEKKLKTYTEIPGDPRYKKLAEEIISKIKPDYKDDPMAKMLAIVQYLGENGYYSLKSDHSDSTDPTASFLFGNKTGYCVHFAHAAVFLARSIGIPARVGAGYAMADKRRARGQYLAIMDRDAHAWPEIYLEPYGWIIIDVPIQNYLDPPPSEPNQSLQNTLGQMSQSDDDPFKKLQDEMQDDEPSIFKTILNWVKKVFWILVLGGLFVALVYGYTKKFLRLYGWRRKTGVKRLKEAYIASMDYVAILGIYRKFGESRESFAARASQILPSLEPLTWRHLETTLGAHEVDTRAEGLVYLIKNEVKAKAKWYQQILFYINPYSWLLVR